MPYGEDEHYVVSFEVLIERRISGLPARNDKLAKLMLHRPTDERMTSENLEAIENHLLDRCCGRKILVGQKFEKSIEIGVRRRGEL